ncbi:hypothetical protein Syun_026360 [Stephania yunnanensis]|uniref:DUF4408 domain-containing protein n=1 Tax=Stephania yunnanensis TaxID=152371 RepID=A0AAP0HWY4_9MAGN
MLEESIWASMNSWFTPAVLFVLLNIVIGTIAITSKRHKADQHLPQNEPLNRAPSLLYRLKSIDFTATDQIHYHHHHNNNNNNNNMLKKNHDEYHDEHQQQHQVTRSVSDTKPASGESTVKLAKKMMKSASVKSAFAHFEEDREVEERRRPATARDAKQKTKNMSEDLVIDEGVDARADDFINRFKQQLKLQRLDSLIRYKEMLTRVHSFSPYPFKASVTGVESPVGRTTQLMLRATQA